MAQNYCDNCGEPLQPYHSVCPNCGKQVNTPPTPPRTRIQNEGETFGWAVLGFFIPIVGLVLFLVWQNDRPKAGASAGKGALVGFIVGLVLGSFSVT